MKKSKSIISIAIVLLQFAFATTLFAGNNPDSNQKKYFLSAQAELNDMLSGKTTLNYERAIFIMENAYYDNKINFNDYEEKIEHHLQCIKSIAINNNAKSSQDFKASLLETTEAKQIKYFKAITNFSIFKYLTDTTFFVDGNKISYRLPYSYSYEDPLATADWKNSQVFSLLDPETKKGNCFALASLFKIFSERLNSEANICTAPGHIYIRHADDKGIFYNVELATHSFPGTGTIETLTYTTDDATKNEISLRELDLKQSVALCLVYLAKGYEYKFGIKDDDFILHCSELALQYDSLNLNAMLLKAEVLEERIIKKNKTISQLQDDKEFHQYEKLVSHLYQLGYREMPIEMKNYVTDVTQ